MKKNKYFTIYVSDKWLSQVNQPKNTSKPMDFP